MATSKCGHCGEGLFELKTIEPAGGVYKVNMVQCSACGAVVGAVYDFNAGVMLQIDCPDLAMGRHSQYADLSLSQFRDRMELHVAVLNHALVNIPAEKVRMHLCWGNYPGPHHCDVPLKDIVDVVWKAKPHAVQFEAANPLVEVLFGDILPASVAHARKLIGALPEFNTRFFVLRLPGSGT